MTAVAPVTAATVEATPRRAFVIGAGFCVIAGLAAAMTPRRREASVGAAKLVDLVPRRVGPWSSQPSSSLVVPETDQPTSVYDQVLTQSFFADAAPTVMLLVAYGAAQSGLMKVHRPEICYTSSGFHIGSMSNADIVSGGRSISAETFAAQRQDRVEQVVYWTRVSNGFPRDLASERLLLLRRGLQGLIPDGVLVRASVLGEGPFAVETLRDFLSALVASASGEGRALLVGRV